MRRYASVVLDADSTLAGIEGRPIAASFPTTTPVGMASFGQRVAARGAGADGRSSGRRPGRAARGDARDERREDRRERLRARPHDHGEGARPTSHVEASASADHVEDLLHVVVRVQRRRLARPWRPGRRRQHAAEDQLLHVAARQRPRRRRQPGGVERQDLADQTRGIACRVGDNRFMLLLTHTPPDRAAGITERIRRSFAAACCSVRTGIWREFRCSARSIRR